MCACARTMNARREPDTKKNFIDLRARAASARASRRAVIHVRHARRATRLRMNARFDGAMEAERRTRSRALAVRQAYAREEEESERVRGRGE